MNAYIKKKIDNIIIQLNIYDCEKDYNDTIKDINRVILNRKRTCEMIKNNSNNQVESFELVQKELNILIKVKELISKINNRFEDPATILNTSINLLKSII